METTLRGFAGNLRPPGGGTGRLRKECRIGASYRLLQGPSKRFPVASEAGLSPRVSVRIPDPSFIPTVLRVIFRPSFPQLPAPFLSVSSPSCPQNVLSHTHRGPGGPSLLLGALQSLEGRGSQEPQGLVLCHQYHCLQPCGHQVSALQGEVSLQPRCPSQNLGDSYQSGVLDAWVQAPRRGTFSLISRDGHLGAKASGTLIPHRPSLRLKTRPSQV